LASSLGDRLRFLGRFLLKPVTQASAVPSSPHLVAALLEHMELEQASVVVELGPGTGVATKEILPLLAEEASFLVIEKDKSWVKLLGKRYPGIDLVCGDAAELGQLVEERGLEAVDAVVSGLPFAFFGEELQVAIIDAVATVLRPGGRFSTFTYIHSRDLPRAKRFKTLLESRFSTVEVSDPIWRNTPPAVVYTVTKD